jgi:prepilin-type processing-associated H-X9-DG protein
MGLAIQMHHDAKKMFPTGRDRFDQYAVSWAFRVLPFMEEKSLVASYVNTVRVDDPQNAQTMRSPVNVYACPSRRPATADRNFDNNDQPPQVKAAAALGDYAASAGHVFNVGMTTGEVSGKVQFGSYDRKTAGAIFSGSHTLSRNVLDGLTYTFAVGERHIPPVPAGTAAGMEHYAQGDTAFLAGDMPLTIFAGTANGLASSPTEPGAGKFGSEHSGVSQFVFLDGHVTPITSNIATPDLMALSTIAGNEPKPQQY